MWTVGHSMEIPSEARIRGVYGSRDNLVNLLEEMHFAPDKDLEGYWERALQGFSPHARIMSLPGSEMRRLEEDYNSEGLTSRLAVETNQYRNFAFWMAQRKEIRIACEIEEEADLSGEELVRIVELGYDPGDVEGPRSLMISVPTEIIPLVENEQLNSEETAEYQLTGTHH